MIESGGLNPYSDVRADDIAKKLYEQIRNRKN
jgi:hypothetical protein